MSREADASVAQRLSDTFRRFFDSERSSGLLLLACTVVALVVTNSPAGPEYQAFWRREMAGLSLAQWINDALMAVFFLLIGLELERELYVGELSNRGNALLPVVAAVGGMAVPAAIHFAFNSGTQTQSGFGIPMATDIAFAIAILATLGRRIPASLKVFVVAFAVIDDLGAIGVIAVFYSERVSAGFLAAALAVWALLVVLNRLRVMSLAPYLAGGALMWFLALKSGVHPTVAGVLLAFAIPFTANDDDRDSPSHALEHRLNKPVAFAVLPVFALANAGVDFGGASIAALASANGAGIVAGLVVGKPLGVVLFCLAAVALGACRLPPDLHWSHLVGAGALGGIGFTMSIFIAGLAFSSSPETLNGSKMAVLLASVTAAVAGSLWLRFLSPRPST